MDYVTFREAQAHVSRRLFLIVSMVELVSPYGRDQAGTPKAEQPGKSALYLLKM